MNSNSQATPSTATGTWTQSMDGTPPIVNFSSEEFWTQGIENDSKPQGEHGRIVFQHGPIAEVGVNGTTLETVMRAVIARLRGFNDGPFRCRENSLAITHFEEGLHWLYARTTARREQGVEGVNLAHVS